MLWKKEYMCDCWGPFLAERYFRAGVSNRMCSWNLLKIELLRVDKEEEPNRDVNYMRRAR